MRQPVCSIPPVEANYVNKPTNKVDEVKQMLHQLLDAVEVSELSDSLIKEDTLPEQHEETNLVKPISPISQNVGE